MYMADAMLFFVILVSAAQGKITGEINPCTSKETCGRCIGENPNCGWCSQEDYTERAEIPRCNLMEELEKDCNDIMRPIDNFEIIKDVQLSDKGSKEGEAIQIKPQEIRISAKPNSPVTFQVEFRQAVGYPVDLYYLMDLSYSMKDDKKNLALLGTKLAEEMEKITPNFRLGFGSFVDKKAAPYVDTTPEMLEKPCPECAAPYGFLNNMPLSLKTAEFAQKVTESEISGNLDGIEGSFDAIMQAIVCKEEVGWRNKSRKLLVVTTDNGFHFAGDGKLAGIVMPNDRLCHLDSKGYYTMTDKMDYPSISQLNRKIKEEKVTLIFAVTESQIPVYKQLSQRLIGSTVGTLAGDSSNVVKLIRDQYNKITSHVEMTTNLQDSHLIQVSFESSCVRGEKQRTNICKGLKDGTSVVFDVTVEVSSCPDDKRKWNQTFDIYPIGLSEFLTVNLEMICECDCEKSWNEETFSRRCNKGKGTYECGICSCYGPNYGKECECDATESDRFVNDTACIKGNDIKPCSDLGICRCGKCYCNKRSSPEEKIYGTFCECNNFSCDRNEDKFCNGPDHGTCDCGKCKCLKGWTGLDCGCKESPEDCIDQNGIVCSDHGHCSCGKCICDTSENEYIGKFCDDCLSPSCTEKCTKLEHCATCFFANENGKCNETENCNHKVVGVDELQAGPAEKQCIFEDEKNCRISFKYSIDQPLIYVKKLKECSPPVNVWAIVSGAAGSVVGAGLLLLLMWKCLTTVHDRRELAKFEKERLKAKWDAGDNPLYKQATSTFQNPVFGND